MLEWNQQNQLSKELVHRYGAEEHVCKVQRMGRETHNFKS
jgi:hypothetical protein